MNNSKYQVRHLKSEHLALVSDLYRLAFQKEPSIESFQWKYFEAPIGNAKLVGIYFDTYLVGFGALLPEQMRIFDKVETVFKCTDLMVHPAHQKKGLAKMIIDSLISSITSEGRISNSYTMCSKIATYGFAKYNYVKLSNIYNYFKPYLIIKLNHLFNKTKSLYAKGIIKKYDAIPSALSDYTFSLSKDKIEVVKSFDYLKWRIENPNYKYNTVCYFDDNVIVGYIIVGVGKSNILNIIDFEVKDNSLKVLKSIIKAAEHEVIKNSYKGLVGITKVQSSWAKTLRNYNFLVNPFRKGPLPSILDFNVLLAKEDPKIMKVENWEINSINYDDI